MKKVLLALLVSFGLQTQAQINYCDSLSYSIVIDSTTWNTLMVTGNANGISNIVNSIDWNFTACTATGCYAPQGNDPYSFPAIYPSDTVKLCYDALVYSMGTTTLCNHCDSMIYDFNTDCWITFGTSGINSINELTLINTVMDNRMYDLLGRELKEAPIGQIYIQNRQKHIKLEEN